LPDLSNAVQQKQADWKEQLAYILSYSSGHEKQELAFNLGEDLVSKRDMNSAMICFMISRDVERVVTLWKKRTLFFLKKGSDRNDSLFQLVEKAVLLKSVVKETKSFNEMDMILCDFADYINAED